MKYFLDTEFYEDGRTIDLISIGIVAEDGREFYAVNGDFNWDRIFSCVTREEWEKTDWIRDNVMPYINRTEGIPREQIRDQIIDFVNPPAYDDDEFPELTEAYWFPIEWWGYYADYDWVAFCQLFGRMIDLPTNFPKFCRDIKQVAVSLGNPKLPVQTQDEHHALADARWNKQAFDFLVEHKRQLDEQAKHERLRQLFEPRFPEQLEIGGQNRE